MFFRLFKTCCANSLVGSTIKHFSSLFCISLVIIGSKKANVFPVPVCEEAIISFPSKAKGIVSCCIFVGIVIFKLFKHSIITLGNPSSLKSFSLLSNIFTFKIPVSYIFLIKLML